MCIDPLPVGLVATLIKNECPLCGRTPAPTETGCSELLQAGCGHDHRFCADCLGKHVLSELHGRRLPRCPRAAECRNLLELGSVELALTTMAELGRDDALGPRQLKERLMDWHDLRTGKVQDEHPLLRSCKAADCNGRVRLPRAAYPPTFQVKGSNPS